MSECVPPESGFEPNITSMTAHTETGCSCVRQDEDLTSLMPCQNHLHLTKCVKPGLDFHTPFASLTEPQPGHLVTNKCDSPQ